MNYNIIFKLYFNNLQLYKIHVIINMVNLMNSVVTALLTIIIFVGIVAIIYILFYNNLQAFKIKINEAESIIDEHLRKKYDSLKVIVDLILEETSIKDKLFDEFLKIKNINMSSFDLDRKLTELNILVDKIKIDNDKLEENEVFSSKCEEIYEINEKLEATKSFYNKYTTLLNKSVRKFPSNIIAFVHHIRVQSFFDGKDMFDDDIKDFKL